MPTRSWPRRSPSQQRRGLAVGLVVVWAIVLNGCSNQAQTPGAVSAGLLALAAGPGGTTLTGWDPTGPEGTPIKLPQGETTWISAGRAAVLAATLASGKVSTSDPVHLGKPLAWRPVKAKVPTGETPAGPDYFATWDPEGGRFATLAGDLLSGDGIHLVLVDPSAQTAFEVTLDRSVVAAPPVWIDADRVAVVTGDAAAPTSAIVDSTTGEIGDGPAGARLMATSVTGRRIATMAAQGAPIVIHDTAGWLAGDGSQVGSIAPPSGSTTAIAFALDSNGQRLAVAWAARDGSVTIAIHDGRSDWRRVAQPKIGPATGAVVAWMR